MVLDSCHSGGAARGPDSAIRGVAFIDRTERPSESLVGNPEELRSAWEAQVGPNATRSLTSALRPAEYVLLAACRPSEFANEYAFDGRQRNGALTYWLLDTLKQQGPAPTFQMIHDRIVAKIHETFPAQTSVLIGDPGRVAFQDLRIEPAFTIPVAAVNLGAKQLTLSAGLSAGLAKGAEFVIYPRTETDLSQIDTRKAWVRLTKVRDSESDAEIVEQFEAKAPEPGDQAVLVGAATQALVRNVRLVRRDLKPLTDDDTALLAIKKALPGNGWVELVEAPEQSASFVVRLSEDGPTMRSARPTTSRSVSILRWRLPMNDRPRRSCAGSFTWRSTRPYSSSRTTPPAPPSRRSWGSRSWRCPMTSRQMNTPGRNLSRSRSRFRPSGPASGSASASPIGRHGR